MVVIEAWPSVAWTRWMGAPRSRAWEAWAWRSQCGETARSMPARSAARRTMRSTATVWRPPPFARAEDRILVFGSAAERGQKLGDRFGQLDGPGLGALAPDRNLGAVAVGLHVAPAQAADFADSHGGGVEQQQENTVAGIRLQAEHAVDIAFRQDSLRQAVLHGRQAQRAADIEREVADAVAEGEQRFDGGEHPVAAGRRQAAEGVRKDLEIGEGDGGERLPCPGAEAGEIGAVGALGMQRPAVEPDVEEVIVGRGLWEGDYREQGRRKGDFGHLGQFSRFPHPTQDNIPYHRLANRHYAHVRTNEEQQSVS